MKTLLILLMFVISSVNAQTKKATSNAQTKKVAYAKPTLSEIDKLFEKYKNTESVKLFTPHGEILGVVSITTNEEDKPVSVIIKGNSANKPAIAEFISNTIKMKLKQGYKTTKTPQGWGSFDFQELVEHGLGFFYKEDNSFQLLMRKGNMYFRAYAGCCAKNDQGISLDDYSWEIETGDMKRQGGKQTSAFEF